VKKEQIMAVHKCHCKFIPPEVLENLARAGVDSARLSINQSEIAREDRRSTPVEMETLMGIAPPGEGPRKVYDSQNTWVKRVSLERGEGDPATGDDSVDQTYDYLGQVSNFFKEVLNRNSYDNLGADIIANVHYGANYMNAFWDGDELTFGEGDGVIFTDFSRSLDVVAHEFGHGVVQTTANLQYFSQSGALNEHFADVFGSAITQFVLGQSADEADWLIGDEIMGPDLFGEALRSMRAPGTAYNNSLLGTDPQPDHMDDYYAGPADNQGVHINSGIPNKAFYLTSKEIGTDCAVLVWYHALQNLWATANFNDAAGIIAKSARILVKNGQVPHGTPQVVRAAFKEVGLPV
jgi:Zn-dependent metalloprotease